MSIAPLMPVYPRCDVRPVRGDNCHLIDEDGTRYLDFASGIAVNLLGHSHPTLIGAIQRQAETLIHVSNLYGSPQGEALARRLVDKTFADTVFFHQFRRGGGGMRHQNRAGLSSASKTETRDRTRDYHLRQCPFTAGRWPRSARPIRRRCTKASCALCCQAFAMPSSTIWNRRTGAGSIRRTAGFLVEPIQGEGGIRPASQEFVSGSARTCVTSMT